MRTARGGNRAHNAHPHGRGSMIGATAMLVVAWLASTSSGGDITGTVVAIVLAVGAVVVGLQKLGWLPAGSVAKAEHERAERAEEALRAAVSENTTLMSRLRELEARTNLEPLIEAQRDSAATTAAALEQMAAAVSNHTSVVGAVLQEITRHNRETT